MTSTPPLLLDSHFLSPVESHAYATLVQALHALSGADAVATATLHGLLSRYPPESRPFALLPIAMSIPGEGVEMLVLVLREFATAMWPGAVATEPPPPTAEYAKQVVEFAAAHALAFVAQARAAQAAVAQAQRDAAAAAMQPSGPPAFASLLAACGAATALGGTADAAVPEGYFDEEANIPPEVRTAALEESRRERALIDRDAEIEAARQEEAGEDGGALMSASEQRLLSLRLAKLTERFDQQSTQLASLRMQITSNYTSGQAAPSRLADLARGYTDFMRNFMTLPLQDVTAARAKAGYGLPPSPQALLAAVGGTVRLLLEAEVPYSTWASGYDGLVRQFDPQRSALDHLDDHVQSTLAEMGYPLESLLASRRVIEFDSVQSPLMPAAMLLPTSPVALFRRVLHTLFLELTRAALAAGHWMYWSRVALFSVGRGGQTSLELSKALVALIERGSMDFVVDPRLLDPAHAVDAIDGVDAPPLAMPQLLTAEDKSALLERVLYCESSAAVAMGLRVSQHENLAHVTHKGALLKVNLADFRRPARKIANNLAAPLFATLLASAVYLDAKSEEPGLLHPLRPATSEERNQAAREAAVEVAAAEAKAVAVAAKATAKAAAVAAKVAAKAATTVEAAAPSAAAASARSPVVATVGAGEMGETLLLAGLLPDWPDVSVVAPWASSSSMLPRRREREPLAASFTSRHFAPAPSAASGLEELDTAAPASASLGPLGSLRMSSMPPMPAFDLENPSSWGIGDTPLDVTDAGGSEPVSGGATDAVGAGDVDAADAGDANAADAGDVVAAGAGDAGGKRRKKKKRGKQAVEVVDDAPSQPPPAAAVAPTAAPRVSYLDMSSAAFARLHSSVARHATSSCAPRVAPPAAVQSVDYVLRALGDDGAGKTPAELKREKLERERREAAERRAKEAAAAARARAARDKAERAAAPAAGAPKAVDRQAMFAEARIREGIRKTAVLAPPPGDAAAAVWQQQEALMAAALASAVGVPNDAAATPPSAISQVAPEDAAAKRASDAQPAGDRAACVAALLRAQPPMPRSPLWASDMFRQYLADALAIAVELGFRTALEQRDQQLHVVVFGPGSSDAAPLNGSSAPMPAALSLLQVTNAALVAQQSDPPPSAALLAALLPGGASLVTALPMLATASSPHFLSSEVGVVSCTGMVGGLCWHSPEVLKLGPIPEAATDKGVRGNRHEHALALGLRVSKLQAPPSEPPSSQVAQVAMLGLACTPLEGAYDRRDGCYGDS